ncbi:hypothetical protein I3760_05G011700 [Carya illinoinensis]|nr:hypothetical protein I3760_05G011700 [Carya illinoinensis]
MGKGLKVVAGFMSFFLLISLSLSSMQLNVTEARRLNGELHIGDDHHSGREIDELSQGVTGSTSGLKSGGRLHTYYKYSRSTADHSGPSTPPGAGHKNVPSDNQ